MVLISRIEKTGFNIIVKSVRYNLQNHQYKSLSSLALSSSVAGNPRMGSPSVPNNVKPTMSYGGAVIECCSGLPMGVTDIGESETGYLARVSMPGLKRDECEVRCRIDKEGIVEIRGKIPDEGTKDGNEVKVHQLYQPGPFCIAFELPGPVDPRLYSSVFRGDGIFELVVRKRRVQDVPADSGIPPSAA